jgi:ribosome-binding factor A
MTETIKQRQVAKIMQWAMSEVFRQEAAEILQGAMVSVSHVKMTPDLLEARIYLSIFNTPDPDEIMQYIQFNNKQIRGALGKRIKNQVRRIPELNFYRDDTLEEVMKLEALFKEIRDKENRTKPGAE